MISLSPFVALIAAGPAQKAAVKGGGEPLLRCSFCGKSQRDVKKLIAGPNVYICNECVALCNEILAEDVAPKAAAPGVTTLPKK